jgi:hypothetical protein
MIKSWQADLTTTSLSGNVVACGSGFFSSDR